MPSRNYACITEVLPNTNPPNGHMSNGDMLASSTDGNDQPNTTLRQDGKGPLHAGEEGAGTEHPAADGINTKQGIPGGLNVSIRVEIDNQNRDGQCEGYGFSSMSKFLSAECHANVQQSLH
jgi:hypothetical protein